MRTDQVEVPRPSSSRMTSERGVASLRIFWQSSSSTAKSALSRQGGDAPLNVELAAKMRSSAPMRVLMRSQGEMRAEVAGTYMP